MSNNVTVQLKGDSSDLDRELRSSTQMVTDYSGKIKGLLIGIGSAIAVKKLADFSGSMISLYNTQIEAETKLGSVIRATGGAAGYSLEQFKDMASELQELTGIGDEVILNAQAIMATFKNIKGDTFRDATIIAADMAAVLGTDLTGAAMQVAKALNDPTKGMAALADAGVSFTEQQKEMIKVLQEGGDIMGAQKVILDELAGEFGGAAADQANTFSGQLTKLWNRLGDVGEVIGGTMVPAIQVVLPLFDKLITVISSLSSGLATSADDTAKWAESWSGYFESAFETVLSYAVDAFSTLEFLYSNWSNIWERTTYAWMLSTVSAFEDLKHLFTETAPAYLEWFFDNWANLLTDYASFQLTVYKNMWKNVVEFFEGLQAWLSGNKGGFEFVALTEGFEASTKKLPEIAARNLSDTEKYLKSSIKQLDDTMGTSYMNIFEKNKKWMDDLFKEKPKIEVDVEPKTDELEKVDKKVEETSEKINSDMEKTLDYQQQVNEQATLAGQTSGLEDLAKSIQAASFEVNRDVTVQVPKMEMPALTQEDAVKELAKNVDKLQVKDPKPDDIVKAINGLAESFPPLINRLTSMMGLA